MAITSAASWIQQLNLTAHEEGGFYSEVYRSGLTFDSSQLPDGFIGNRSACTHIYFLLTQEKFSAFHRIRSDELWHFYNGDPLLIYELDDHGYLKVHSLGPDLSRSQSLFTVIKAGNWFASKVADGGQYGLVGCTVAPGFDFADFEMAKKEDLLLNYPEHHAVINELSRS